MGEAVGIVFLVSVELKYTYYVLPDLVKWRFIKLHIKRRSQVVVTTSGFEFHIGYLVVAIDLYCLHHLVALSCLEKVSKAFPLKVHFHEKNAIKNS